MRSTAWRYLSLFCGAGGGSLGFTRAGFECVGAFDADERACRDHEYLTGHRAEVVDLGVIQPHELAQRCSGRPDVVFTSPPCKGFSAAQTLSRSRLPEYRALNSLAERGVALALEAWETPPPIILLENVPRVLTRGQEWLDRVQDMLRAYGYSCSLAVHDCGEWGHLAQRRKRVLLVARHNEQVPNFVLQPPVRRVRGIGEVLMDLPVPTPGSATGGPMHALPALSPLNWVRLALIRAGGDWRDLPEHVALVEGSVADTRLTCSPRSTVYGVADVDEPSGTVVGWAKPDNGAYSVADPRVVCRRNEGGHGVRGWDQSAHAVISHATIHNFSAALADPRIVDPRLDYEPRRGTLRVEEWAQPSHVVIGDARANKGANGADPRPLSVVGAPALEWRDGSLYLDGSDRPTHLVIRAADGTWHRPMTTLELAVLQGLPARHNGDWLRLDGDAHGGRSGWRQRIGNMVPPPTAEAIARTMAQALNEASQGAAFALVGAPIWVEPPRPQHSHEEDAR